MIDVCLLGTGGMMPLPNRWLSSVLLRVAGQLLLLDCGEGTQISLKQVSWGFRSIGAIAISHYHADHVSGLPGLLLMIGNSGRTEPLDVFGPPGLRRVLRGLRTIAPELPYRLRSHELVGGERFQSLGLHGQALAVDHALPCLAYRFTLPRAPRFDPSRARALGIPKAFWKTLQRGQVVAWNGRLVEPAEVLGPPRRGLSVAFVTDTRPTPELPTFLAGVDLLVCEGTYGDDADLPKAVERKHLTFREAATLARDARAGTLWLTHFSPALTDPAEHADRARAVFPNTVVGYDHLQTTLRFAEEAEPERTAAV